MLFTSQDTPHITLSNEQCLKLLLGVCNTKKRAISLYLWEKTIFLDNFIVYLCVCTVPL
jgi:hypothetical protein